MGLIPETFFYDSKDGAAWHRVGTPIDGTLNSADAVALVQPWRPEKAPAFVRYPDGTFRAIPGVFGMTQGADGDPLPGVSVGEEYEAHSAADLASFLDALRIEGDVELELGGSMDRGRRVWFSAKAGQFTIRRGGKGEGTGDEHGRRLFIYTAHDGSSRTRCRYSDVRPVCENTLAVAFGENRLEFAVSHSGAALTAESRLSEARRALDLLDESFGAHREVLQGLADSPMTRDQFRTFAAQILTGKDDAAEAAETVAQSEGRTRSLYARKGGILVAAFEDGAGNFGQDRYDALNAVTQVVDWGLWRKDRPDEALDKIATSSQFGHGAALKERALGLLVAAA